MKFKTTLCALLCIGMMAGGCATGGGASSEDKVMASLLTFKEGLEASDIDKAMSVYSDDFRTGDGADKSGAREFFQGAKDNGLLDSIEVGIEETELVVEDDEIVAEPVSLLSDAGVLELSITFKEVGDLWLIVYATEF